MSIPVDESVDPFIRGPQQSDYEVDPVGIGEDRHIVGSLDQVESATQEESPETELTDQERNDFKNLMTVGRRFKTVDIMDHKVVIQTMTVSDECRVGLYTKQYMDTQYYGRAHQIGICASGVVSVDSKKLYVSMGSEDPDVVFNDKVEILEKYYPITITQIYDAIMSLESEFRDLAQRLGKLPG